MLQNCNFAKLQFYNVTKLKYAKLQSCKVAKLQCFNVENVLRTNGWTGGPLELLLQLKIGKLSLAKLIKGLG